MGDANGKSDPYCVLSLSQHSTLLQKVNSSVKPSTLNPTWDEDFSFNFPAPLDWHTHTLKLQLLDRDLYGLVSEPLGVATIPLSDLVTRQTESLATGGSAAVERFYELKPQGRVSLTAFFPGPHVRSDFVPLLAPLISPLSSVDKDSTALRTGRLDVRVVGAKELRNVLQHGRMSCYVRLALGRQRFQTKKCVHAGLSARWNEHFEFGLDRTNESAELQLEVLHDNMRVCGRHVSLAELLGLSGSGPTAIHCVNRDATDCDGKLTLDVTFTPAPQEMSALALSTVQLCTEALTIPPPPQLTTQTTDPDNPQQPDTSPVSPSSRDSTDLALSLSPSAEPSDPSILKTEGPDNFLEDMLAEALHAAEEEVESHVESSAPVSPEPVQQQPDPLAATSVPKPPVLASALSAGHTAQSSAVVSRNEKPGGSEHFNDTVSVENSSVKVDFSDLGLGLDLEDLESVIRGPPQLNNSHDEINLKNVNKTVSSSESSPEVSAAHPRVRSEGVMSLDLSYDPLDELSLSFGDDSANESETPKEQDPEQSFGSELDTTFV